MRKRPHGIMFHHFHDESRHPKGQGSITGTEFSDMIAWLRKGYHLIGAQEWYDKAVAGTLEASDVCITFDDNLLCQYDIALPVLEAEKLTAFWFVYTSPLAGVLERLEIYRYLRSSYPHINDFYKAFDEALAASPHAVLVAQKLPELDLQVFLASFPFYSEEDKVFRYMRDQILGQERYYEIMDRMLEASPLDPEELGKRLWNNAEQVKYLHGSGHLVGLHSHSHPTKLNGLSPAGQLAEYSTNRDHLETLMESKVVCMSHPCNSYDDHTLLLLQEMGVKLGFRANMDAGYTSAYEYPRLDHALLLKEIKHG